MKKPRQSFFVIICFSVSFLLRSYAQAQAGAAVPWGDYRQSPMTNVPVPASERQVTIAEYCDFLNHVAASDSDHLYDEKMGTDSEAACILRFGKPGNYFYQVIVGRGNFPVMYVNSFDEKKYSDWCQNGALVSNEENGDGLLKSSQRSFALNETSTSILTLATVAPASTSNFNSYIEDVSRVAVVATAFALAGFSSQLMMDGEVPPDQQAVVVSRTVIEKLKTREIRRNHESLQSAQRMLADKRAEWSVWDAAATRYERADQDLQEEMDRHIEEVTKDDRMIVRVASLVPHTIAGAAKTDIDTCRAHLEEARAIAARVNEALSGAEIKAKAASDDFSILHDRVNEADSAAQQAAAQLEKERQRLSILNNQRREALSQIEKYRAQAAQAPALIATHTEAASAAEEEAIGYDAGAARKINPDKKHADQKKAESARARALEFKRKVREVEASIGRLTHNIRAAEESIRKVNYNDQMRAAEAAIARYSSEFENAQLRLRKARADEARASELVKTTRAEADALKTANAWEDIALSFYDLGRKIMTTAPFDLEGAKAAHEAANAATLNKQAYDQNQRRQHSYAYGRDQQQPAVTLTSTLSPKVNLFIKACKDALTKATASAEVANKAIAGQKYEFYNWTSLSKALKDVVGRMEEPVDLTALKNARTVAQDEMLRIIEFTMLKFHGDVGREALQMMKDANDHVTDKANVTSIMDSVIAANARADAAEAAERSRSYGKDSFYNPTISTKRVRDEMEKTLKVIESVINGDAGEEALQSATVAAHINRAREQVAASAKHAAASIVDPVFKTHAAAHATVNESSNFKSGLGYQWQDHLSHRHSYPSPKNIPQLLADIATATEAARLAARAKAATVPIVISNNVENEALLSAWASIRALMDPIKDRELHEAEESVKAAQAALAEAEEVGDCIIN
ncbi:MAG: hypothetical protein ACH346_05170 [Chthoniobacterales bacterium]